MVAPVRINDGGSTDRIARELADAPRQLGAALSETHRRAQLSLLRQLDRLISDAIDLPPDRLAQTRRLSSTTLGPRGRDGVSFWIGTNPIPLHRFGPVTWARQMAGARVNGRTYPGTWSWGRGKTGPAVMERTGRFGRNGNPRRERIAVSVASIHHRLQDALRAAEPELRRRYLDLLRNQVIASVQILRRTQR